MALLDYTTIRNELLFFVRNADILTTTQRGVTTATATGTLSSATELVIDTSTAKNVRSVVVASVTLGYGDDYTVDTDYDDSGTFKLRIAFTTAQTGSYSVQYDTGADKIFGDFPRNDLTISSFPRIAVDVQQMPSVFGGFNNVLQTEVYFTVVVYGSKIEEINNWIAAIRGAFHTSYTSFYSLSGPIRPVAVGPCITSPREKGKDKIFQQNIDFVSMLNFERP